MVAFGRVLLAFACCGWGVGLSAADDLDALFDLDKPLGAEETPGDGLRWSGYGEFGAAYTYPSPGHWSKLRGRFELAGSGRMGERARFKLSARADADAAYELERHHYPGPVRRDQRTDFMIREAYADFSSGDWEFRLGRQHVVWGEAIALFVADVVSARDLREFVLPEFETLRIPQWAARAEYFGGDTYFELLWIPVPSFDRIGRPGADFYPFPLPPGTPVHEKKPARSLENSNWGLRVTRLIAGWDLSAFYYRSLDVAPTLYRTSFAPTFELRHDRIRQIGTTVSKDFGRFVLKGEAVHTDGRRFNTEDPRAPFGLKSSDTLDYLIGVDVPVADLWRFTFQYSGRSFERHEPGMGIDRHETGLAVLVNRKLGNDFEAEVLVGTSFNRTDYMLRPKLIWTISRDWRGQIGADVFGGRDRGLFGRYDDSDRVYIEVRRWF